MHALDAPPPLPGQVPHGEVGLRDPTDLDVPALVELWRELMAVHVAVDPRFALAENSDARFLAYLESALDRDDYRVRVASVRGRPVGFYVACVLPNSPVYRTRWVGYINDLCVTASHRRRGIGERLVQDAVRWLRNAGAESVELYVSRRNTAARAFWARVGGAEYLERLALDLDRFEPGRGDR